MNGGLSEVACQFSPRLPCTSTDEEMRLRGSLFALLGRLVLSTLSSLLLPFARTHSRITFLLEVLSSET
jgi:hypothetical protein